MLQQNIVCRAPRHAHHISRRASIVAPMRRLAADRAVRQRLRQSLAVNDQVVVGVLAVCPVLAREQQLVSENLDILHSMAVTAQQVRRLVLSTPQLLAAPIQAWQEFLAAYGLQSSQIWRLLVNQPKLLVHGSIFAAGRAIMFVQQLGWSEVEISTLVIQHPQHSAILLMDVDKQLQPVLQCLLQQHSMTRQQAAAFLHSNPHVLYTTNHTVLIQQLVRRQKLAVGASLKTQGQTDFQSICA